MTEIVAFLQYYAKRTAMLSVRGTAEPAGQQARCASGRSVYAADCNRDSICQTGNFI